MNLLVISDSHIIQTPDNKYWCNTAVHGYDFWKRYIEVFDEVHVISRVQNCQTVDEEKCIRADGDRVKIVPLPFVRGFKEYIKNFISFSKSVKEAIGNEDAAILRVPSLPAYILLHYFKKLNKPYAFEVIVDPVECYRENKLAQVLFTYITKRECMKANGVSYVTQFFLQKHYPCRAIKYGESKDYFTTFYSSINLDDSFFGSPRHYTKMTEIHIIHVASAINSDVKGQSTLIDIVERLKKDGYIVHAKCLGAGDYVSHYKKIISDKGLEKEIQFLGLFSSKNDLKELLLNSDIFVFPTKAEGLPRAIIEAMATGLPCLSTPVNGIPELLEPKYMFNPKDVDGFTNMIKHLINTPEELNRMSARNIKKAESYKNEILSLRRQEFYTKLKRLAT